MYVPLFLHVHRYVPVRVASDHVCIVLLEPLDYIRGVAHQRNIKGINKNVIVKGQTIVGQELQQILCKLRGW